MTDYVEYKPPAYGVAPRGWQEGMAWDVWPWDTENTMFRHPNPEWSFKGKYRVPPAALHYPIVPYEGEEDGPDIPVNGKPDWLAPEQKFSVTYDRGCITVRTGHTAEWSRITKIRLPASHGYYADNPASDEAVDVTAWLRANLPAIEAAGHKVEFAPDWAEQLWADLWRGYTSKDTNSACMINLIRSRVRPVL